MKKYPTRADFVEAMQFPHISFQATELKESTLIYNGSRLVQYSGGYSTVFPFHNSKGKKYALRLWNADIGEAKIRTSAVSKYLQSISLKYFVDFKYVENAVLVAGELHPAVLMDWVDGMNLKDYVNYHINDSDLIKKLAENLREMFQKLNSLGIAHGDLQHGNILIRHNGEIMLVDYDSMFVEGLTGKKDIIKGLPGYQHPGRISNKYTNHVLDYFSQLVIYLSLIVYSEMPELWDKYYLTEDFLFSVSDFKNVQRSDLLKSLRKSGSKQVSTLCAQLEVELSKMKIESLRPLEGILKAIDFKSNTSESHFKNNLPKGNLNPSVWSSKIKKIVDKF